MFPSRRGSRSDVFGPDSSGQGEENPDGTVHCISCVLRMQVGSRLPRGLSRKPTRASSLAVDVTWSIGPGRRKACFVGRRRRNSCSIRSLESPDPTVVGVFLVLESVLRTGPPPYAVYYVCVYGVYARHMMDEWRECAPASRLAAPCLALPCLASTLVQSTRGEFQILHRPG